MNGARGHGYAAEYANNALDRITGKNVKNVAQELENGKQIKHGADKIINSVEIQTKYYKTAEESIGAAFVHKKAIYIDKHGNMMQIEVPRDQYQKALKLMQKRIDSGQVTGAQTGDSAEKYLKKGWFTYEQSHNIAKAGTIEGIGVDMLNGSITSMYSTSFSGIMVFAAEIWNGKSPKDAVHSSFEVTYKIFGKSIFLYTMTMQLSRKEFANLFTKNFTKDMLSKGFEGIQNPIYFIADKLANSINKSVWMSNIGLKSVSARGIISNTIMGLVTFAPDISRALSGKISKKQLLKNSSVSSSAIIGSTVGQAIIPIPVFGSILGGTLTTIITKKLLDNLVEDDAKKMFQILKEEFLDVIFMSRLSQAELLTIKEKTISTQNLSVHLQNMYQSKVPLEFARAWISEEVQICFQERANITKNLYLEGVSAQISEVCADSANQMGQD